MWEVIAAIVLMLIVLLAMVLMPFLPGRTLAEETEELRKAGAELRDAIVHELRLDWLCEKLNDLILAAQKALADALAWDYECKMLHRLTRHKQAKGTFNEYLRARWGDGNEKKKGETQ